MTGETLYKECPLCEKAPVTAQAGGQYVCNNCQLTLKDRSILGLFRKGKYGITGLGEGDYALARKSISEVLLPPEPLKVVIGNIYTDGQLAEIAGGNVDVIAPVKTILAQIILEQLNEDCYINVNGLRRGFGPALVEESSFRPTQKTPRQGMEWQDEGNLFCTTHRIVLPSNQFTFIRLDRKVVAVQAFTDGVAIQRKREEFATYFVGGYSHEAALVAAYVMAKVPALRPQAVQG
jgi:hypothetical protein